MQSVVKACRPLIGLAQYGRRWMTSAASPLGADKTIEHNLQTETNRLSKTSKKFWSKVNLKPKAEDGRTYIYLDDKPLRTPLGFELGVPSGRVILPQILRDEWENLPDDGGVIKATTLPITSLVCRCIDMEMTSKEDCSPELAAKMGGGRQEVIDPLLRYLDTDTFLCLSPKEEYEGELRKAQEETYLPMIAIAESVLQNYIKDEPLWLRILDADVHGLRGNSQPESVRDAASKYLKTLDIWDLVVFEKIVLTTKSFIAGIILLEGRSNNFAALNITTDDILRASDLERIYQVKKWGHVPETHALDERLLKMNLAAASIVSYQSK